MNHTNSQQSHLGLVFGAGLLAGYVASMLIPENVQEKAKEQLGESAKKLRDNWSSPAEIMDLYRETRSQIMDQLAEMQLTWEDIDKRKYTDLVKKSLETLVEERGIPDDQIKKLQEYLADDYGTFRSSQKRAAK
jgi:hypothetical protein